MRVYRPSLIFLFLASSILIGGCSSGSVGGLQLFPDSGSKVDTTGVGLELDFDVSTQNVRAQQVRYSLSLENTGEKPIEIRRGDNFYLRTLERSNQNAYVFTQDSVERNLYDKLFQDSSTVTLYQNQEIGPISGTLEIADWYWEKETADSFSYRLIAQYEYETVFTNTVEVNRKQNSIRVQDLSQGAPVQVTEISLQPHPDQGYYLNYFIEDRGPGARDTTSVRIEEMQVSFGTSSLGSCEMFKQNDADNFVRTEQDILNQNTQELIYSCQVGLDRFSEDRIETSKTSGSFSYTYTVKNSGSISLPERRRETRIR